MIVIIPLYAAAMLLNWVDRTELVADTAYVGLLTQAALYPA